MPKKLPTQKELQDLFDYRGGLLVRRKRTSNRVKIGDIVKTKQSSGYGSVSINRGRYLVHRVIWKLLHGTEPELIDHINGNRSDNRIENLRSVDMRAQSMNLGLKTNNSSGVMGVGYCNTHKKWRAHITVNGKFKSLGYFFEKENAIAVRQAAEKELRFHHNHGKRKSHADQPKNHGGLLNAD